MKVTSQIVDFLVLLLLTLDKDKAVVETFLHQVHFEVLSQHFDFAT